MCKLHDKFYNENQDTASRNISDVALAHAANEIANNPKFDSRQRRDASFVSMVMKNKARFGLGLKNFKRGSSEETVVGPFEKLAEELHKPIKRKFQRRHVDVWNMDDSWGADLVDMREWEKQNKGYKYMLNVIDVFSKYAWSIPMKNKTWRDNIRGI